MLRTLVLQGGKYYTMKGLGSSGQAAPAAANVPHAAPMERALTQPAVRGQQKGVRPVPGAVKEIPLAPLAHGRSAK